MCCHKISILHILRIRCSKHNITSSLKCDNILYNIRLFQNLATDAFMMCYQGRFLVNDQRDAQFFSVYLSLFLTLYMFRAHCAHQERQIVSIQLLVAVGGRVV